MLEILREIKDPAVVIVCAGIIVQSERLRRASEALLERLTALQIEFASERARRVEKDKELARRVGVLERKFEDL